MAQDKAAIAADQAQIDTAKLNIAYCRIVAPVNGRVGLRLVDPGNYLQPSDTTGIVVITEIDPISVIFSTAEDNLPQIAARMKSGAKLTVDRLRPHQLQGAGDRDGLDLRQPDRPHHRHLQAQGAIRQRRRRAVPQPVRQHASCWSTR